jgi:hypothetical protein
MSDESLMGVHGGAEGGVAVGVAIDNRESTASAAADSSDLAPDDSRPLSSSLSLLACPNWSDITNNSY